VGIFSSATPAQSAAYSTPRPLTAAAAQVKVGDKGEFEQFRSRRNASSSMWQQEAWEYYDAIGEIKYAFNLVASVVSRVRLYPAVVTDASQAPQPIHKVESVDRGLADAAERALARLDSAYGGQAGLLRDAALNLSVAGECYLVQVPERLGSGLPESWDVKSIDEVVADPKGNLRVVSRREASFTNQANASSASILLGPRSFVGRIWRSHPRFSDEADSSLRGLLDLCAELLLLNRTFRATARSRLNAGALYLPDGLAVSSAMPAGDMPYGDETDVDPALLAEEAEDDFENQLIDAMTTPIKDEDSASAVVPLIIRGPAELGDKIKQFKFERSFDPALAARSYRVLERILQGLDVPKDIVTGLANVKYSNALQIDEALYKAHIEPLMLLIVDALTVVYMRPYLIANGYSPADVDKVVIWYDPSAIATRNDRAADADSGFEKGAISFDTWRRAHGFSDGDAPSADESVIRMILEKGMVTPELTESILNALAPDVLGKAREVQQASSVAPVPPEIAQMLGGQPPAGGGAPTPPPLPTAPSDGAESIPTEPTAEAAPTPGGPAAEVEPGVPNIDDFLTASALVADAGAACPPATQDVVINLNNRKKAIDGAMYGPLNPAEPNTKYWKELAGEWQVSVAEAKKQRCGNCAVFIVTPEMKECIEGGLTDNADEFDAIDAAGELGYCEAFDFKCAAARTCRAWIAGGPITEEKSE
jgi:hypothetical protein